jgi:hypothetical protein
MGSLEQAGVYLGDVNRGAPRNPKGTIESDDIKELNTKVLANTGHTWRNPPEQCAEWLDRDRRQRDLLIKSFPTSGRWGFKDPRTTFTLEGWLEVLPNLHLIGTVRHPVAVARSLHNRTGMRLEKGLVLWAQYNLRMLDLHEAYAFPIVNFDLPREQYEESIRNVCLALGLSFSRGGHFFDEQYRHETGISNEDVSPFYLQLYGELIKRTVL